MAIGLLLLDACLDGVGTVVNAPGGSTVNGIVIKDLVHTSHAGSPTAYSIVSGGGTIPVSVGRTSLNNVAGLATGPVSLSMPGGGGVISGPPTITLSPTSLGLNLSVQPVAVTGSGFTMGTTFAISGLAGTSLADATVNSPTSRTLMVITGSTSGVAAIQCSNFAVATLAVSSSGTIIYLDDTFQGLAGAAIVGTRPTSPAPAATSG